VTGSLARRYARAVLGLAREQGALAAAGDDLARSAATFADATLRAVVLNPAVAMDSRRKVVDAIVQKLAVSTTVGNLIRLLADRDRLAVLPDVAREYQALVDRELGRARVTIRSAVALSDAQRGELERLALHLTGKSEVIASMQVDPDLIAGVVLDVGGTVYDGSVETQLARLAKSMAGAGA
jgi:F-type H+-transporting ATPase subunit delta